MAVVTLRPVSVNEQLYRELWDLQTGVLSRNPRLPPSNDKSKKGKTGACGSFRGAFCSDLVSQLLPAVPLVAAQPQLQQLELPHRHGGAHVVLPFITMTSVQMKMPTKRIVLRFPRMANNRAASSGRMPIAS